MNSEKDDQSIIYSESVQIEPEEQKRFEELQTENLKNAINSFKQYISNKEILNKISKDQQEHEKLFQDLIN